MRQTRSYIESKINDIQALYKEYNNKDVIVLKSLVKYPNKFRYQLVRRVNDSTGEIETLTDLFDSIDDLYLFSLYMTMQKEYANKLMSNN